jgi:hypothetical protein
LQEKAIAVLRPLFHPISFYKTPSANDMKKCFLTLTLIAGIATFGAQAQVLLADTALISGTNSMGSPVSGSTVFTSGATMDEFLSERIADDFTIPGGEFWQIDSLITYGYEFNGTGANPFVAGYVRLFDGVPGSGGNLIAGNLTTNRLAASSFTGAYRVDNNTPNDFTRPIWRLSMSVPATTPAQLAAGTYWISWSAEVNTTNAARAPYKVLPNGTSPAGQNGRKDGNGTWFGVQDNDKKIPLGFNIILKGTKSTEAASVGSGGRVTALKLYAPFPNPASGAANLSFSLPGKSHVSLRVLNSTGQCVATAVDAEMTAGEYIIPFSTVNLASGLYRVVMRTDAGSDAATLTVK